MPGVLYASRERGTRSCCCRRAIQACDDDLLPRVSCVSITELQHELTPCLPLQRVWFRLARVTPHKGPVLAPWLPRNQSGVARPRTRTMAGYSDRCAGQCSSRDSGPRVPHSYSPRSYNYLSQHRPNNVLHSAWGTPLPSSSPTTTTSRYMGAGDYSDTAGWGRGLSLAYGIGIPLGIVVGLGMLFFCGYICTRSGTKEIVETAANGGRQNQPTRLETPFSNRAPAVPGTGRMP